MRRSRISLPTATASPRGGGHGERLRIGTGIREGGLGGLAFNGQVRMRLRGHAARERDECQHRQAGRPRAVVDRHRAVEQTPTTRMAVGMMLRVHAATGSSGAVDRS
ncbi:hypothetical protein [Xanthomonas sp. XNM01]|uniref:hypothetical protein n=1 Tax=Xanthomonas sp. XNM01 TaxID=2769289 RepID=UPI0017842DC8|nr:hypothetical protein [Xanthomonas sp. XNM01]MBD9369879.1 hypothetical protein [Xanthomonas sp. XNM01]